MDLDKVIPQLKTGKPADILKKIVAFNTRAESDSRAFVRIGLGSGFSVEGTPIKMDKQGNVVFTATDKSISYINANSIMGIQILNPQALLEVLTEGACFAIDVSSVPTSLELKRELKNLGDFLKENYGVIIKSDILENEIDTDAEKFQFQQFLNILQNSIQDVADDSMGKEALGTLEGMKITTSENALEIEKNEEGDISIGINFKNKFKDDFKKDLQERIESKL